ncbi:MAG TPA: hypothetical protein VII73_04530 [Caulobacteraceae bacterium]
MRKAAMAAVLLAATAGGALAQTPSPPPPPAQTIPLGPPRAFPGYSQPQITAASCRAINSAETQCTIPAMTAGRYLIEAAGTSTWAAADPVQALGIQVGPTPCGRAQDKQAWTKGPRTFRMDCVVSVLTDRPLTVFAVYQDSHATKDPRGPSLTFRQLPWDGLLAAAPFVPKQQ